MEKDELSHKFVKPRYLGFISNASQLEFIPSLSNKSVPFGKHWSSRVEILAITRNQPEESICMSI